MDYLQFASEALVSGVGLAGLVLSAFHVKNANTIASDTVATLGDVITAMHGNLSGVLAKLAAASPGLMADGVRLVGDVTTPPPGTRIQAVAGGVAPAATAGGMAGAPN